MKNKRAQVGFDNQIQQQNYPQSLPEQKTKSKMVWILLIGIIIVLVIGVFIFMNYKKASANTNEEELSSSGLLNQQILDNLKLLGLENEINRVLISSSGFSPFEIKIKVGEKVVWINEDSASHSIAYSIITNDGTSQTSDSGSLDTNFVYGETFFEPMIIEYSCGIHSNEKGKIIID